jgi:hypothetical protein
VYKEEQFILDKESVTKDVLLTVPGIYLELVINVEPLSKPIGTY